MSKVQFKFRMQRVLSITFVFSIMLGFLPIAKAETSVALWQGDKKGAVSMSFDDGLPSQFNNAFPILQQHALKATFFIISDALDVTQTMALVADGQEIGSHSVTHSSLTALPSELQEFELSQSQLTLQQLTGQEIATFAYPYGDYDPNVINIADDYYIAVHSTNSNALNASSPALYELNIIWPNEYGYGDPNVIPYLQDTVDLAVAENKWAIEMFHSIGIAGGYDTVSSEALSTHMDYLVANEPNVWVAPMGIVSEYIYERDVASVTTLIQDSNTIQLDLQCGLDSRFNTPLTLLTDYPQDWEYGEIHVRQGQIEQIADVVSKDGSYYIMYDAVPDAGTIELSSGPLCIVDLGDFATFAAYWLDGPCNESNDWCGGADLNQLNDVNIDDLTILANEWLNVCPADWPLK